MTSSMESHSQDIDLFNDVLDEYMDWYGPGVETDDTPIEDVFWETVSSPGFVERAKAIGIDSSPHLYIHDLPDAIALMGDDGFLLSGRATIRSFGDHLLAEIHLGSWTGPLTVLHEAAHVITAGDGHGNAWLDAFEQLVSDRYGEDARWAFRCARRDSLEPN